MGPWRNLLGPHLIWAVHFAGVYAIASVFDVLNSAQSAGSRLGVAAFSVACLAAAVVLGVFAARDVSRADTEAHRWMARLGVLGAGVAALSIVWQGLPALFALG
ncbi:MAG: hypothetical protein ACK4Z5_04575 [Brevundimonas sp.]